MPYQCRTKTPAVVPAFRIDTKSGRGKLAPRREPYWWKLAKDRHVGFRRMGSGSETWIARFRGDDGHRVYKALGDRSDTFGFDQAVATAQVWFSAQARGVDQSVETVGEATRAYVENRRSQKGEACANDIARRFERSVYGRPKGSRAEAIDKDPIAGVRLSKLRAAHIEQWRDRLLTGGLSRAAVNRTMAALRAAINDAAARDPELGDTAHALRSVKNYKGVGGTRDLFLDLQQRRALVNACSGGLRDLVEAALLTGARPGELVSARRAAFDSRTDTLALIGKTGARTIQLSSQASKHFARLAKGKLPTAYLLTRDDGHRWAHSDWDQHVRAAVARAGLPAGTCLYTCRHAWISQALMDGMSLVDVAKLSGTSIAMINQTYGHVCNKDLRAKLARISIL